MGIRLAVETRRDKIAAALLVALALGVIVYLVT